MIRSKQTKADEEGEIQTVAKGRKQHTGNTSARTGDSGWPREMTDRQDQRTDREAKGRKQHTCDTSGQTSEGGRTPLQ